MAPNPSLRCRAMMKSRYTRSHDSLGISRGCRKPVGSLLQVLLYALWMHVLWPRKSALYWQSLLSPECLKGKCGSHFSRREEICVDQVCIEPFDLGNPKLKRFVLILRKLMTLFPLHPLVGVGAVTLLISIFAVFVETCWMSRRSCWEHWAFTSSDYPLVVEHNLNILSEYSAPPAE
jgi:hypothetical protein